MVWPAPTMNATLFWSRPFMSRQRSTARLAYALIRHNSDFSALKGTLGIPVRGFVLSGPTREFVFALYPGVPSPHPGVGRCAH